MNSVLNQTYKNIEIIIVNGGSTDSFTNDLLNRYERPRTRVVRTANQGLAEARNYGIRKSFGKYILPLDADDKIAPEYCKDAVNIIEHNPDVGIVHCETQYFGAKKYKRKDPEFSLEIMLARNIILCCSLFRKSDWEKVNGYNKNMVYGGEDWDFWLSLIELKKKVYKIPKYHFFYRIRPNSMARSIDKEEFYRLRHQIFMNHTELYNKHFEDPINLYHQKEEYFRKYNRLITTIEYKIASKILVPIKAMRKKIKRTIQL